MFPPQMSQPHKALGLIQGKKVPAVLGKILRHHSGILPKPGHALRICPAAPILQCLGILPVEQGKIGLDAIGPQFPEHILIIVNSGLVDLADTFGQDSGPVQGKTVIFHSQHTHQGNILPVAVDMVAGRPGVLPLIYPPRFTKSIPHRLTAAVSGSPALNLVGAVRHAPCKILTKHIFSLFPVHTWLYSLPIPSINVPYRSSRFILP